MELVNIQNPATIKNYFLKVRELQKSGKEFPVNLDDVWQIIYSERGKSVRALKANFIENEDYILLAQNGKQRGGHNKIEYFLSVSAMEYFIAKKVKAVFDVYREVFHSTIDEKEKPLTEIEILVQNVQILAKQDKRISAVEEKLHILEHQRVTRPDYFAIAGYASLNGISVSLPVAAILGRMASKQCKDNNIDMGRIHDPRFGEVKTYPMNILEAVFKMYFNNNLN